MNVLTTQDLTKKYGRRYAIHNLNLEIPKGSVFGLLGPNGSGKTTTLGIVSDILQPNSGHFQWFGQTSSPASRKRLGIILETPNFYPYLNAEENLRYIALIKQSPLDQIDIVLEKVGLLDRKKDAFKTYSLGMKQRLAIGAALLGDPEVLILDEPTNGLDPNGIADVRNLIRSIAEEGITIILASHLLDEVEKVCDHFAVLSQGETRFMGKVSDALGTSNTLLLDSDELEQLEERLKELQISYRSGEDGALEATIPESMNKKQVIKALQEKDIILTTVQEKKNTLEQEFLKILNQK